MSAADDIAALFADGGLLSAALPGFTPRVAQQEMAVAVGAACDFLTPIGHQCNTLVMGPGGYKFSDYPRLGAPLSAASLAVPG